MVLYQKHDMDRHSLRMGENAKIRYQIFQISKKKKVFARARTELGFHAKLLIIIFMHQVFRYEKVPESQIAVHMVSREPNLSNKCNGKTATNRDTFSIQPPYLLCKFQCILISWI